VHKNPKGPQLVLSRTDPRLLIRLFEMENGEVDFDLADATFQHEVPAEGHFYLGTQCFQCADPPCVRVCPVGATWQEPDGITVIDYDWCIGCRFCMAACPYGARSFNWGHPKDPPEAAAQPYSPERGFPRRVGTVEKCDFCPDMAAQGKLFLDL
jgi:molybdopterin-containing oxidoreductase family iron-sulfur binding subunit